MKRHDTIGTELDGFSLRNGPESTFGTARMILTANSLFLLSRARTTLPNVPWPSRLTRLYLLPMLLPSCTM